MSDRRIPPRWPLEGPAALGGDGVALAHSLLAAAERFGLDRKTVRDWRDRLRAEGASGLIPRYPKRRPRRILAATSS